MEDKDLTTTSEDVIGVIVVGVIIRVIVVMAADAGLIIAVHTVDHTIIQPPNAPRKISRLMRGMITEVTGKIGGTKGTKIRVIQEEQKPLKRINDYKTTCNTIAW